MRYGQGFDSRRYAPRLLACVPIHDWRAWVLMDATIAKHQALASRSFTRNYCLQLMQYNSDLCVRAHRDEYNFVSSILLDELLTKPQTQGGPRFLYLYVSV